MTKINVLVKPGSRRNEVIEKDGMIVVFTNKRAHDGEANRAVVDMMAKYYGVAKGRVKILRGEKGRRKIVEIVD